MQYMTEQMHDGTHIRHMAKHLLGLFHGIAGARAFRRHLSTHMYADDADLGVVMQAITHIDLDTDRDRAIA
jgi:tRNA-dihydrouridine synthase A